MKKKILAVALALTVACTMLPFSVAFASEEESVSTSAAFNASEFYMAPGVYSGQDQYACHPTYYNFSLYESQADYMQIWAKSIAPANNQNLPGSYTATIVPTSSSRLDNGGDVTLKVAKYNLAKDQMGKSDPTQEVSKVYRIISYDQTVAYTGKALKPKVKIQLMCSTPETNGFKYYTLKKGTDYTVTYGKNTGKIGSKGTITIKGKGKKFCGSKKLTFAIGPKQPTVKKLTVGKKKITIKLKTTPAKCKGTSYAVAYMPLPEGYSITPSKKATYTSPLSLISALKSNPDFYTGLKVTYSKKSTVTLKKLTSGRQYAIFIATDAAKKPNFKKDGYKLSKAAYLVTSAVK